MIKIIGIVIMIIFIMIVFVSCIYFLEYYIKPVVEELLELFKNSW